MFCILFSNPILLRSVNTSSLMNNIQASEQFGTLNINKFRTIINFDGLNQGTKVSFPHNEGVYQHNTNITLQFDKKQPRHSTTIIYNNYKESITIMSRSIN